MDAEKKQNSPLDTSLQNIESNASFQTIIPTKNVPALFAYYCGVFGLLPLVGLPLSIAAIFLAKKGLSNYKITPTPGAKGHALTGLILGIVGLSVSTLLIIFIIFVLIPYFF